MAGLFCYGIFIPGISLRKQTLPGFTQPANCSREKFYRDSQHLVFCPEKDFAGINS